MSPRQTGRGAVRVAILLAGAGTAALANAQGALEEVVVTAQKREQRSQDVPIPITAFSADALRELSVTDSNEVAQHTPGLNFGAPVGQGNNPSLTLRGVGLNDFNDNNESPVAVYVDEIYSAALASQTFQLFDIDRVEVLRGPQGTLFGRNTTGGLLHFVSNRPTRELSGNAQLDLGRFDDVQFQGAISGPLTDGIQGRLAVARHKDDGYFRNAFKPGGDPRNETDSYAYRGMLNFDLAEKAHLLLNVHGGENDVLAAVYKHQGTSGVTDPACSATDPELDGFGYCDSGKDIWSGAYDRRGPLKVRTIGGYIHLDWDLPIGQLVSISSLENLDKFHQEDTDASPNNFVAPTFTVDSQQWSQEIRLAHDSERLHWVAGLYYFHWKADGTQILTLPFLQEFGLTTTAFVLDTQFRQKLDSYSGFGNVEIPLSSSVNLIAGLRYTNERKTYNYVQVDRDGGVLESAGLPPEPGLVVLDFRSGAPGVGDLNKLDKDAVSGKIGINWKPRDDVMLFADVSRGFKSGGFNSGFVTPPTLPSGEPDLSVIPYKNETLTAYQLGVKSSWVGGKLRVNATAFHYSYDDLQALTFVGVSSFITNASNATIDGGEIEIETSPTENLHARLGVSLLDATADQVTDSSGEVLRDRRMVLAPRSNVTGLVRYSYPAGPGLWYVQADAVYESPHFFDIKNQPVSRQAGYTLINGRVGFTTADGKYEVALWGKNLSNKQYDIYTFDFTGSFGFNQRMVGNPRWYGLELVANF
ncbi:MAG TPA: TonB-dependent receptor [Steroidobacteraceae bacterium]|jgi:iron complex outermembrane receptor protein|nr:TonB-dependent receptor [Steroidobacteraceae bacterium]